MWCQFVSIQIMIKKVFSALILFTSSLPNTSEKLGYLTKVLLAFTPIAYILNQLGLWFDNNEVFFRAIIFSLFANVIMGAWYHYKNGTFRWNEFFIKNIKMWVIILMVYPLLESFAAIAGENYVGQGFKIIMQISTLLYPASKVLKNSFIISNGTLPPEFMMKALYNFEKSGDLRHFNFKDKKIKNDLEQTEKTEDYEN